MLGLAPTARRAAGRSPRRRPRAPARCCWCRCRRGPARPGRAATTRLLAVIRAAPRAAARAGHDAWPPLLRSRGGVRDQAGLDAAERAANLAGSMLCPTARLRRLAGHAGAAWSSATTCSRPAPRPARRSGRWRRRGWRSRGSRPWRPPRRRRPEAGRRIVRTTPFVATATSTSVSCMESVRVRGCVGETPRDTGASRRQADASRRRNGPRKRPLPSRSGRRSRCGLDVSPAPAPSSDAAAAGRRSVVAEKLREPQQAIVGSKTRSAGRTPLCPAAAGLTIERRAHREVHMEVVVTGRHCELSDRFRSHVDEKLARLEKHDHRIIRVQVEVENERNPRQHDRAVRVELTAFSKGPVIRAEAAAEDKMAALDLAARQDGRADAPRRRPAPGPPRPARAGLGGPGARRDGDQSPDAVAEDDEVGPASARSARSRSPVTARSWCARRPTAAHPMTLDQALYEMELVGHDFYLFVDKESERPVGRLPPPRLRLRRDLAGARTTVELTRSGWPVRAISPGCAARSCHDACRGEPNTTDTGREPIRVLVVDDQELFRRGLTMLLAVEDGIEVVGEAGDGVEGTALAERVAPDVVLLDVRMPKRSGIEACLAIKEAVPSAKIIMLTVSDEEADLYEAVKSGASGYLLKDSSIEEVAQAVRVVADGQSLISPSMAVKLIDEFKQMSRPEREPRPRPAAHRARARGAAAGRQGPEQPRDRQASSSSARTPSRTTCATSWRSCSCTRGWRPSCTPSARSCSTSPEPGSCRCARALSSRRRDDADPVASPRRAGSRWPPRGSSTRRTPARRCARFQRTARAHRRAPGRLGQRARSAPTTCRSTPGWGPTTSTCCAGPPEQRAAPAGGVLGARRRRSCRSSCGR